MCRNIQAGYTVQSGVWPEDISQNEPRLGMVELVVMMVPALGRSPAWSRVCVLMALGRPCL